MGRPDMLVVNGGVGSALLAAPITAMNEVTFADTSIGAACLAREPDRIAELRGDTSIPRAAAIATDPASAIAVA